MKISNPRFKISSVTSRYALIHGSYWMAFGASYNFVTVYLLSKQYTSPQIGIIMALTNVFSAILQPYVASSADSAKKLTLKSFMLVFLFLSTSLSGLLIFSQELLGVTALLYFLLLLIMLTIHPLLNGLGMKYIEHGYDINFGFSRGMGSLSYAVMSVVLGNLVEKRGPGILPLSYFLLFSLTTATTLYFLKTIPLIESGSLPEDKITIIASEMSLVKFIRTYKKFSIYLFGSILIFICFNIINIYMIKIIQQVGGNEKEMGTAFAIAALVELPFMLSFTQLLKKYSVETLLRISALAFTAKALLTFFADSLLWIYIAQGLQMFSYALFIPGSIYYVTKAIHKNHMLKGQAFTTAATTLGAVLGSVVGGYLVNIGIREMLLAGFLISVAGTVFFFIGISPCSLQED